MVPTSSVKFDSKLKHVAASTVFIDFLRFYCFTVFIIQIKVVTHFSFVLTETSLPKHV